MTWHSFSHSSFWFSFLFLFLLFQASNCNSGSTATSARICESSDKCRNINGSFCKPFSRACKTGNCVCKEGRTLVSVTLQKNVIKTVNGCATMKFLDDVCNEDPLIDRCMGDSVCHRGVCDCVSDQWTTFERTKDNHHCRDIKLRQLGLPCTSQKFCYHEDILYLPEKLYSKESYPRCQKSVCSCPFGYRQIESKSHCMMNRLNDSCESSADCKYTHGVCNAKQKCMCTSEQKKTEIRTNSDNVLEICVHKDASTDLGSGKLCNYQMSNNVESRPEAMICHKNFLCSSCMGLGDTSYTCVNPEGTDLGTSLCTNFQVLFFVILVGILVV